MPSQVRLQNIYVEAKYTLQGHQVKVKVTGVKKVKQTQLNKHIPWVVHIRINGSNFKMLSQVFTRIQNIYIKIEYQLQAHQVKVKVTRAKRVKGFICKIFMSCNKPLK